MKTAQGISPFMTTIAAAAAISVPVPKGMACTDAPMDVIRVDPIADEIVKTKIGN